jgi:hypothetical protein
MTITNGYCTLAELKAFMTTRGASTGTDAADDAVMEQIVEGVSRFIDRTTGRRFYQNSADESRYYDGRDDVYKVYTDDIASITSVAVDYEGYQTTYTTIDADDYTTLPDNAALKGLPITGLEILPNSDEYFPATRKAVKVTGKYGYASIPLNIKDDCMTICLNVYQSRSGQNVAVDTLISPSGVVHRSGLIPAWVQSDLISYRSKV